MTFTRWIRRNLAFYWRQQVALGLAVVVATAVLTGALVVGDSVEATLTYALEMRLGEASWVVTAQERFFSTGFSQRLADNLGVKTAPLLQMRGLVASGDGNTRVRQVQILGVDQRFFTLSPGHQTPENWGPTGVFLNEALKSRLGILDLAQAEVVLRVDKPGAMSRDLVMSPASDQTLAARLPVLGIASDLEFGRFGLAANQQAALNVLVPLTWLQKQLNRPDQANLCLVTENSKSLTDVAMNSVIRSAWRLEDAEVELRPLAGAAGVELRSARVFLDAPLGRAAQRIHPAATALLTYFVNDLRVGQRHTPYSMVTAVEPQGAFRDLVPSDMTDDQVVINAWLANDLQAQVGDTLEVTYFIPSGARQLTEDRRSFRIAKIVPLSGPAADPNLMPDFPGLADAENCSDWDPGLPLDLDRVRETDEAYWDDYRGTPKAFITLAAGQALWANRYGDLTAVRFPVSPASVPTLKQSLRTQIDPAELGFVALPVRVTGEQARTGGTDFGQLFLGLSMFLIAAAVLLIGLLFVFSIQSRMSQTGMLLAVGFPPRRLRSLYLWEGAVIALVGTLVGTRVGLLYTRVLLYGLSTAWQGAVSGTAIRYAATGTSLVVGGLTGLSVAVGAMVWTLRKQLNRTAHALLVNSEDGIQSKTRRRRRWVGGVVTVVSIVSALLLVVAGQSLDSGALAGVFFGAGTLLLTGLMTGMGWVLERMGNARTAALPTLKALALRSNTRRAGRSLAVIAMLACGVFMVVAVGANRKDPRHGADVRSAGTGGFSLYAESSVPITQDLNSEEGQKNFGLDGELLADVGFVPLRVRPGDDASCLNLNRAQQPRLL
ncbi:FtsX-like permease family protein, partial [Planctomycetota bacterium]